MTKKNDETITQAGAVELTEDELGNAAGGIIAISEAAQKVNQAQTLRAVKFNAPENKIDTANIAVKF